LTIRPLRSRWPDGITKFRSPAAPNYRKHPDSISSGSGIILDGAKQQNLVITPSGKPAITVDDIEVAQFIYLMLNNQKIYFIGRRSPEQ
jgi:hypothetical protein